MRTPVRQRVRIVKLRLRERPAAARENPADGRTAGPPGATPLGLSIYLLSSDLDSIMTAYEQEHLDSLQHCQTKGKAPSLWTRQRQLTAAKATHVR